MSWFNNREQALVIFDKSFALSILKELELKASHSLEYLELKSLMKTKPRKSSRDERKQALLSSSDISPFQ